MEAVTVKKRSKSTNASHFSPQVCDRNAINVVSSDCAMKLNSRRNRCRVIILQKSKTGSYGFTLQTYAFKNSKTGRAELLTYVDYVQVGGPASRSGMKRGDVILSINDKTIEGLQHEQLVQHIKQGPPPLRLMVTYEDWCTRIDLNLRKLKLKQRLREKYLELAALEMQERELMKKAGQCFDRDPSNECSSELSSSDQLSPFSSKRASFMCASLNTLHVGFAMDSPCGQSPSEGLRRNDPLLDASSSSSSSNKPRSKSSRVFECHSLPIVRKKKHFLQNQVFSVCENVVKMGCFSRSSVNFDGSSLDNLATVDDLDLSAEVEITPRTVVGFDREQSKTWYGVPKSHRAALLKRQRKTSEASKWYFSIFDEEGRVSTESRDGRATFNPSALPASPTFLRESLFVPAEATSPESSAKVLSPSTLAIEKLINNLQQAVGPSGGCDQNSDLSQDCQGLDGLSLESQEFMSSLPSCDSTDWSKEDQPLAPEVRKDQRSARKKQLSMHAGASHNTPL